MRIRKLIDGKQLSFPEGTTDFSPENACHKRGPKPRDGEVADQYLTLRLTKKEKASVEKAALKAGEKTRPFARKKLLRGV